jgi:hypothetical protein
MKRLFFLLLLAGAGYLVYRYYITRAEGASCHRLAELCGHKGSEIDKCVDDVRELGKANKEAVAKFNSCVADAKSCGEGAGCLVGAGFGAAGKMFEDFLKGVGKALK